MARYLQKFSHVRRFLKIAFVLFALLSCGRLLAQPAGYDVFVPISKYMAQGNADNLSAWFDDNLEIAVVSQGSNASKAQAKQIVKTFFENYTPRSFEVNHTAQDRAAVAAIRSTSSSVRSEYSGRQSTPSAKRRATGTSARVAYDVPA